MNIIKDMKDRVKMVDLLRFYGIEPVRSHNNYKCFVHDDHNPSAGITKDGEKFKCFACGYSGDIVDVVCQLKKCDMKKAIRIIDNDFCLGLFRELTQKEKLELARQSRERERQLAEKKHYAELEKKVLIHIADEIHIWEGLKRVPKCMKGKRPFDERLEMYLFIEQRLIWLNWLFDTLCGFRDKKEMEWDYSIGTDKMELLKAIEKGELLI